MSERETEPMAWQLQWQDPDGIWRPTDRFVLWRPAVVGPARKGDRRERWVEVYAHPPDTVPREEYERMVAAYHAAAGEPEMVRLLTHETKGGRDGER